MGLKRHFKPPVPLAAPQGEEAAAAPEDGASVLASASAKELVSVVI